MRTVTEKMWNAFEDAAGVRIAFSAFEKGLSAAIAVAPTPSVHPASDRLGSWMSAALSDPSVCDQMKEDIEAWFEAGQPRHFNAPPVSEAKEITTTQADEIRNSVDEFQQNVFLATLQLREKLREALEKE